MARIAYVVVKVVLLVVVACAAIAWAPFILAAWIFLARLTGLD